MDERDLARRIAELDQAQSGVADMARLAATFHRELIERRMPRSLASKLTQILVMGMVGGQRQQ